MEQGGKLLGALEVAGAALFTVGMILRSAHRRLWRACRPPARQLKGLVFLVFGADQPLGRSLCIQLVQEGCLVTCVGESRLTPVDLPSGTFYLSCDPARPDQLSQLSQRLAEENKMPDVLVWLGGEKEGKTALDQIANIVSGDLMKHFHVVSQFVPMLSRRPGGHFVMVHHGPGPTGSFVATEAAIADLADTLIHQMNTSGTIRITRVLRRPTRPRDEEDLKESAAAIMRAVETGDTTVTLPSARQHIKNTFRYMRAELGHIWNQKILRQWELTA